MKAKFIAIYGGTNLDEAEAEFTRVLASLILEKTDALLVTGGFRRFKDSPANISVDYSAFLGAREFAASRAIALPTRFQTWLPAADLDRPGVERFREGEIRELEGKSAQARRFTLVKGLSAQTAENSAKRLAATCLDLIGSNPPGG